MSLAVALLLLLGSSSASRASDDFGSLLQAPSKEIENLSPHHQQLIDKQEELRAAVDRLSAADDALGELFVESDAAKSRASDMEDDFVVMARMLAAVPSDRMRLETDALIQRRGTELQGELKDAAKLRGQFQTELEEHQRELSLLQQEDEILEKEMATCLTEIKAQEERSARANIVAERLQDARQELSDGAGRVKRGDSDPLVATEARRSVASMRELAKDLEYEIMSNADTGVRETVSQVQKRLEEESRHNGEEIEAAEAKFLKLDKQAQELRSELGQLDHGSQTSVAKFLRAARFHISAELRRARALLHEKNELEMSWSRSGAVDVEDDEFETRNLQAVLLQSGSATAELDDVYSEDSTDTDTNTDDSSEVTRTDAASQLGQTARNMEKVSMSLAAKQAQAAKLRTGIQLNNQKFQAARREMLVASEVLNKISLSSDALRIAMMEVDAQATLGDAEQASLDDNMRLLREVAQTTRVQEKQALAELQSVRRQISSLQEQDKEVQAATTDLREEMPKNRAELSDMATALLRKNFEVVRGLDGLRDTTKLLEHISEGQASKEQSASSEEVARLDMLRNRFEAGFKAASSRLESTQHDLDNLRERRDDVLSQVASRAREITLLRERGLALAQEALDMPEPSLPVNSSRIETIKEGLENDMSELRTLQAFF